MTVTANSQALATQTRHAYIEGLINGIPNTVEAVLEGSQQALNQLSGPGAQQKRRDTMVDLSKSASAWRSSMTSALRSALAGRVGSTSRTGDLPPPVGGTGGMSLVDHDTVEGEILSSNLALAILDRASWEFSDLRSRISVLEQRGELDANDVLRPQVLARVVTDSWFGSGLGQDIWRLLQQALHEEFAHLAQEGYHEANRLLVQHRVLPEIDLRNFIRRTRASDASPASNQPDTSPPGAIPGHKVSEET